MPSERVSAPLRLHPASLVFSIASAGRSLLVPGIVVLLFSSGRGYEVWAMLFFVPVVAAAVARYISFRYQFAEDELVIREGIFTRKERHIPYARIQNVDLAQNPFHRLLSVATVRIDTAGGDEPEANIRVLSLERVEELRRQVFAGKARRAAEDGEPDGEDAPAAPAEVELLSLPPREVALYGVISNRGMAIVLAALAVFWQLQWQSGAAFEGSTIWNNVTGALGGWLPQAERAADTPWLAGLLALAGIVLLLLLLRVLSVAWAFLKLYGFRLTRSGDDLRTTFGLLTRMSTTIPRRRIQLIGTRQSVLHRWFERLEVRVETAGAAQKGEDDGVSRRLLAPLLRGERLAELIGEVQPQLEVAGIEWRPIQRRAWGRIVRRTLVLQILFSALVARWAWWALPPLIALWWLVAWKGYRGLGWAEPGGAIAFRSGWLVRRISIVRQQKIQALDVVQTPFDRRHRMATLRVDTAGAGKVGHSVRIPYLDLEQARSLQAQLGRAAGRTEFQW